MGTNYKHLSCEERTLIQLILEQGCSLRIIARSLQRAPSSISRELKRNGWTNPTTDARKSSRRPAYRYTTGLKKIPRSFAAAGH